MSTFLCQKYIACFEYVRGVVALAGVRDQYLAPLELPRMEEECLRFTKLFSEQARHIPEVEQNCALLYYDGEYMFQFYFQFNFYFVQKLLACSCV